MIYIVHKNSKGAKTANRITKQTIEHLIAEDFSKVIREVEGKISALGFNTEIQEQDVDDAIESLHVYVAPGEAYVLRLHTDYTISYDFKGFIEHAATDNLEFASSEFIRQFEEMAE